MNTRDDFISAVSAKRGAPDEVQHSLGGVALRYDRTFVTANDREIEQNIGPDFVNMVRVRLTQAGGRG